MTVGIRLVVASVCVLCCGRATTTFAQPASPGAVDPADLPPLPPADEDLSSSATVLAAASAEEDVVVGAAKRE